MNNTWKTLSALNVNDDKEKKGRFDYLSWADAWKHVQNNVEDATYELLEDLVYPDNTREVRCSVTINGVTHTMWLAVMDNMNRAIKNPDAQAINKARMRCFVKAIAMHGLGLYIYQGEDLPDELDEKPKSKPKAKPQIDVSVHPQEIEEPDEPKEGWRLVYHNGEFKDILSTAGMFSSELVKMVKLYQEKKRPRKQQLEIVIANFENLDKLGETARHTVEIGLKGLLDLTDLSKDALDFEWNKLQKQVK
tara:strand:+ start:281 stop:1027 length:747 start_codon:yes stop_codon:yes gene_type:complete